MNHSSLIAAVGSSPLVLVIVFWVLMVLWIVGAVGYRDNANFVRGSNLVVAILLTILGYCLFGFGF